MADDKILSVRMYGEHIGNLEQTPTGKMQFTYAPNAKYELSIGMPTQEQAYDEIRTEAYFGGLLPEGELARKKIGQRFGVNHNNSFALLKAIGYDCAGAVSLHSIAEKQKMLITDFPLKGRIFLANELDKHIQDLPQKPLFLGVEGLRLSLAGAQAKAAVCLIDDKIALPLNGCPTTHILKPAIKGYDGIIQNKYMCLKIADRIGLTVPKVQIRWTKETPYLLIERYDRIIKNDKVSRIHQEDFCQASGFVTAKKYQNDGGPSFQTCFDLLRNTGQPVKDRNNLALLMVFNYFIGNTDAHGKNFSLLHHDNFIQMAPVYDVLCTSIYDKLAKKMAMKIGGYYEIDKIFPRHWERECQEISYSYPFLRDVINKQAENIMKAAEIERDILREANLFDPIIDKIIRFFDKHINLTIKRFEA
jgi:serine/threonine-protein kinase HipA